MLDIFQFLKTQYKDFILLFKSGIFYVAFNEDAYVMNSLFDYQLIDVKDGVKTGFPKGSLSRVITTIEDKKINFVIFENKKQVKSKKFRNNRYKNYSLSSNNFYENYTRLNNVINQLKSQCKKKDIGDLLIRIEDLLNE